MLTGLFLPFSSLKHLSLPFIPVYFSLLLLLLPHVSISSFFLSPSSSFLSLKFFSLPLSSLAHTPHPLLDAIPPINKRWWFFLLSLYSLATVTSSHTVFLLKVVLSPPRYIFIVPPDCTSFLNYPPNSTSFLTPLPHKLHLVPQSLLTRPLSFPLPAERHLPPECTSFLLFLFFIFVFFPPKAPSPRSLLRAPVSSQGRHTSSWERCGAPVKGLGCQRGQHCPGECQAPPLSASQRQAESSQQSQCAVSRRGGRWVPFASGGVGSLMAVTREAEERKQKKVLTMIRKQI